MRYCPRGCIGEQPVVADAMEALRQDVDEEAADELTGCEGDDFVSRAAISAIILVPEGDAVVVGAISRRLEMATRWV